MHLHVQEHIVRPAPGDVPNYGSVCMFVRAVNDVYICSHTSELFCPPEVRSMNGDVVNVFIIIIIHEQYCVNKYHDLYEILMQY